MSYLPPHDRERPNWMKFSEAVRYILSEGADLSIDDDQSDHSANADSNKDQDPIVDNNEDEDDDEDEEDKENTKVGQIEHQLRVAIGNGDIPVRYHPLTPDHDLRGRPAIDLDYWLSVSVRNDRIAGKIFYLERRAVLKWWSFDNNPTESKPMDSAAPSMATDDEILRLLRILHKNLRKAPNIVEAEGIVMGFLGDRSPKREYLREILARKEFVRLGKGERPKK